MDIWEKSKKGRPCMMYSLRSKMNKMSNAWTEISYVLWVDRNLWEQEFRINTGCQAALTGSGWIRIDWAKLVLYRSTQDFHYNTAPPSIQESKIHQHVQRTCRTPFTHRDLLCSKAYQRLQNWFCRMGASYEEELPPHWLRRERWG